LVLVSALGLAWVSESVLELELELELASVVALVLASGSELVSVLPPP
jgi:hypothetical protein